MTDGDQLAQRLESSTTLVGAGSTSGKHQLFLQASLHAGELHLLHNIGCGAAPSKRVAKEQLREMKRHIDALIRARAAPAQLARAGEPVLELVVFSGHMDFTVAEWRPPADIEIMVNLDES